MSIFKLLLVEDNDGDIKACRDTVARYKDEKEREVDLVECRDVKEALDKLDNSFDGAIIDLKLADKGDEGNYVSKKITELNFRIPIAILTGTPDAADTDFAYIGVFKKGEENAGYTNILDKFWDIHDTGLTRIMGGRGEIERALNQVFRKNLMPEIYRNRWTEYGRTDSARTEKALLRHALSHLFQLVNNDGERCFPEEVYLVPPLTDQIHTGSIVKEKSSNQWFVVLNPACDLVIREGGECNTDRILIIEIDLQTSLFPNHPATGLSRSQKNDLEKAFNNKKSAYYHWLPKTDFFNGGFLNFRKLTTMSKEEFNRKFEKPVVQISPFFTKDIIARFSAYYARQGQPDIDFERFISPLTTQTENPE